jgi:GAF domain-containing protein
MNRYRLYLEARSYVLLFTAASAAFVGPERGTAVALGAAFAVVLVAILPRREYADGNIGKEACHNLFALDLISTFAVSSFFAFNTLLWLGFAGTVELGFLIHTGRRGKIGYLCGATLLVLGSGLASYVGRYSSNFLFSIPLSAMGFAAVARSLAPAGRDSGRPGLFEDEGGWGGSILDNIAQLYRASLATSQETEQGGIMDILARDAKALLDAGSASVAIFLEKDVLSSVTLGISSEFKRKLRWRVRKGGMTDWVLINGEPLIINDTSHDARSRESSAVLYGRLKSILAVPLKAKGETFGVLYVGDTREREFDEHDVMMLTILANHAAMSIMETRLAEELRRKLSELERAHRELVGSDQLKSEFISTVTSQMRMPLDAIRSYSQTVLQRIDDKGFPLKKKFLGAVVEESAKLLSTVNSVIDLSRMEFGEGDLRQENISVRELIKEVCSVYEPVCVDREIEVVVEGGEGDPSAYADKDLMYLLLRNLVEFSVSFAKRSTSVRISLGEDESFLKIRMSFQPSPPSIDTAGLINAVWGDGDAPHDPGSVGLALQVSKNIVLRHGGRIWAETHDTACWNLHMLFGKRQRPVVPADLTFDTLSSRPDLKKMLDLVADMVSKALGAGGCFIYLEDTATGSLALEGCSEAHGPVGTSAAEDGPGEAGPDEAATDGARARLARKVFEKGRPILLNSAADAADLNIGADSPYRGYPCALAPVRAGERVIGVMGADGVGERAQARDAEDLALLVALADRVGVAFDRATSYESARNQLVSVMESIKWVLEARRASGAAELHAEPTGATR